MIELYGCISPNVLKVMIALEELELPHAFTYVNVVMGENHAPEFGKLNPNRRVPVIVDPDGPGGKPITLFESGAILIYLAEKAGRLLPADPAGRYIALQWLMFQMGGVGPMFGQQVHFRNYAKDPSNDYSRARYDTEALRLYDVVEERLAESSYMAGNDYTIADIALWPWIRTPERRGVDMEIMPATRRWLDAIDSRPAVRRAMDAYGKISWPDMQQTIADNPDLLDRFFGRGKYSRSPA